MSLRQRIPNYLTFARVLAVPFSLWLMVFPLPNTPQWLLGIFVAAALTDFLDGYLARKWNAVSTLGALLDPIADKLLVAVLLIYLLTMLGTEVLLPVVIILLRELYVSGLREFLGSRKVTLPVSSMGKLKTATQMLSIIVLLIPLAMNPPGQINFPCKLVAKAAELTTSCIDQPWILQAANNAGLPLLYLAALLAFVSAAAYTRSCWKHVRVAK